MNEDGRIPKGVERIGLAHRTSSVLYVLPDIRLSRMGYPYDSRETGIR
ncbi:hypothetical protein HMPREF9412_2566 [Paenibacillus sp. HGF5]|nr:hypothetical protein HMPREF9412_2566 [Paenibacillus sp. HGF5]